MLKFELNEKMSEVNKVYAELSQAEINNMACKFAFLADRITKGEYGTKYTMQDGSQVYFSASEHMLTVYPSIHTCKQLVWWSFVSSR